MSKEDDGLSPRELCNRVCGAWVFGFAALAMLVLGVLAADQGGPYLAMWLTALACGLLALCIACWRDVLRRVDRIQKALKSKATAQGGDRSMETRK